MTADYPPCRCDAIDASRSRDRLGSRLTVARGVETWASGTSEMGVSAERSEALGGQRPGASSQGQDHFFRS